MTLPLSPHNINSYSSNVDNNANNNDQQRENAMPVTSSSTLSHPAEPPPLSPGGISECLSGFSDVSSAINKHIHAFDDHELMQQQRQRQKSREERRTNSNSDELPSVAAQHSSRGDTFLRNKEYEKALANYQEALFIYRKEWSKESHRFESRGETTASFNDTIPEEVDPLDALVDKCNAAATLHNMGIVHKYCKRYQQAVECLREAEEAYRECAQEVSIADNKGTFLLDDKKDSHGDENNDDSDKNKNNTDSSTGSNSSGRKVSREVCLECKIAETLQFRSSIHAKYLRDELAAIECQEAVIELLLGLDKNKNGSTSESNNALTEISGTASGDMLIQSPSTITEDSIKKGAMSRKIWGNVAFIAMESDQRGAMLSVSLKHLGRLHLNRGELDEALGAFDEAMDMLRSSHSENPNNIQTLRNMAQILMSMSSIYFDGQEFNLAQDTLREAIDILVGLHNDDQRHPEVLAAMNNMGILYEKQGDLDEALRYYEDVLMLRTESLGGDHIEVAQSLTTVAKVMERQGNLDGSLDLYREAVRIYHLGNHPTSESGVVEVSCRMGFIYFEQGELNGAAYSFQDALKIERAPRDTKLEIARTLQQLGRACLRQESYPLAHDCFAHSLSTFQLCGIGSKDPDIIDVMNELQMVQTNQLHLGHSSVPMDESPIKDSMHRKDMLPPEHNHLPIREAMQRQRIQSPQHDDVLDKGISESLISDGPINNNANTSDGPINNNVNTSGHAMTPDPMISGITAVTEDSNNLESYDDPSLFSLPSSLDEHESLDGDAHDNNETLDNDIDNGDEGLENDAHDGHERLENENPGDGESLGNNSHEGDKSLVNESHDDAESLRDDVMRDDIHDGDGSCEEEYESFGLHNDHSVDQDSTNSDLMYPYHVNKSPSRDEEKDVKSSLLSSQNGEGSPEFRFAESAAVEDDQWNQKPSNALQTNRVSSTKKFQQPTKTIRDSSQQNSSTSGGEILKQSPRVRLTKALTKTFRRSLRKQPRLDTMPEHEEAQTRPKRGSTNLATMPTISRGMSDLSADPSSPVQIIDFSGDDNVSQITYATEDFQSIKQEPSSDWWWGVHGEGLEGWFPAGYVTQAVEAAEKFLSASSIHKEARSRFVEKKETTGVSDNDDKNIDDSRSKGENSDDDSDPFAQLEKKEEPSEEQNTLETQEVIIEEKVSLEKQSTGATSDLPDFHSPPRFKVGSKDNISLASSVESNDNLDELLGKAKSNVKVEVVPCEMDENGSTQNPVFEIQIAENVDESPDSHVYHKGDEEDSGSNDDKDVDDCDGDEDGEDSIDPKEHGFESPTIERIVQTGKSTEEEEQNDGANKLIAIAKIHGVTLLEALRIQESEFGDHEDVARSYCMFGDIYCRKEQYDASMKCYHEGLRIQHTVFGDLHPDIAKTLNSIGKVYAKLGEFNLAMELHQNALQLLKSIYGETLTHPLVTQTLIYIGAVYYTERNSLENVRSQFDGYEGFVKSGMLDIIARAHEECGSYKMAIAFYEEKLQLLTSQKEMKPPKSTAKTLKNLGALSLRTGCYLEALDYHDQALETDKGCDQLKLAELHVLKGTILLALGQFDKAGTLFREALQMQRATIGNDNECVAITLRNIGILHHECFEYDASMKALKEALGIQEVLLHGNPEGLAETLLTRFEIARLESDQFELYKSLDHLKDILRCQKKLHGKRHPFVAETLFCIGKVLARKGNLSAALKKYEESLFMSGKFLGMDHPFVATILYSIAEIHARKRRHEKALRILKNVIAIRKESLGEQHADVAQSLARRGYSYTALGKTNESTETLNEALEIATVAVGKSHPNVADIYLYMGELQLRKCHFDEAKTDLQKALDIYKSFNMVDDDPRVASTLKALTRVEREELLCV